MQKFFQLLLLAGFWWANPAFAADLSLDEPLDYQVIQRTSKAEGTVRLRGHLMKPPAVGTTVRARWVDAAVRSPWQQVQVKFDGVAFEGSLPCRAGGWFALEVEVSSPGSDPVLANVAHVGVGEVFVVAGQSNSANHGEVKLKPVSGRVASFDGKAWRLADDPQPGASGRGGSFLPPLGDLLAKQFDVPIGFIACGIGATSVREWLPAGTTFPNPPTIVSRVKQRPDGQWESNGAAYKMLVDRMKSVGPRGFRAVLWHQGESDANQKDPTRTLSGKLYRQHLESIIQGTRKELGWDVPWLVAQVSYHVPGDEASPDIRDAQASLWKDGIALQGPDSDALKGTLRERGGKGVHFSEEGLKAHAAAWAAKAGPVVEKAMK